MTTDERAGNREIHNPARRRFGFLTATGLAAAMASRPPPAAAQTNLATTPSAAHQATYFFKNSAFEYVFLTCLGRAYHQAGNVGKVLYLIKQVEDGNFQMAYDALVTAGNEARALAEDSMRGRHRESARQAYLWAQNFYDAATYFADGTGDPTKIRAAWQWMDEC